LPISRNREGKQIPPALLDRRKCQPFDSPA
jgi:hypothetical protein